MLTENLFWNLFWTSELDFRIEFIKYAFQRKRGYKCRWRWISENGYWKCVCWIHIFYFFFHYCIETWTFNKRWIYKKKKSSEKLKTNSSDLERSDETAWNKIKFQKDNKCYCEKHLFKYSPFVCRAENSGIFFLVAIWRVGANRFSG